MMVDKEFTRQLDAVAVEIEKLAKEVANLAVQAKEYLKGIEDFRKSAETLFMEKAESIKSALEFIRQYDEQQSLRELLKTGDAWVLRRYMERRLRPLVRQ
ncbi:MAG: hypothetical protein ACPLOC_03760 [Candidatus Bathyarchaeales archaeon]